MKTADTRALLAQYVKQGSEPAFRELVACYVDLVYSTALRLVDGHVHLAEDVVQTVFIALAQKAATLASDPMLGGWLHRHTCYVASTTMRTERRRQNRERQAVEMSALQDHSQANLAQLAPVLDEAINKLGAADRAAILLRFFEERDFRSVGEVLGSNEDAARMRVNRAVEKLHVLLKNHGVTCSGAALGATLTTGIVTASPAGLAATIAGTALATATTGGGLALSLLKITAMTKMKLGVAAALVLAAAVTPLLTQHRSLLKVREENQLLRQQVDQSAQLAAENERLSNLVRHANNNQALMKNDLRELLKLRAETGSLRRQLTEKSKLPTKMTAESDPLEKSFTPEEALREEGIAKMNYTKNWVLAFHLYSQQNGGQFPTSFDQAMPFLADEAKVEHDLAPDEFRPYTPKFGLTPDHFEIVYQVSLASLTNTAGTIVLREKEPWTGADGSWQRTYGFADGHSELHRAADGNFQPWEAQHGLTPAGAGLSTDGQKAP